MRIPIILVSTLRFQSKSTKICCFQKNINYQKFNFYKTNLEEELRTLYSVLVAIDWFGIQNFDSENASEYFYKKLYNLFVQ